MHEVLTRATGDSCGAIFAAVLGSRLPDAAKTDRRDAHRRKAVVRGKTPFVAIAIVSEKGQVVIPAALRRSFGIKPGMRLAFERQGDTIRVTIEGAVPPSLIDEGYGLLKAARARGQRRLSDFDPAIAMRKSRRR